MHAFIAFALQTTFTSSISKLFPIVQITLLCDHVMQQKSKISDLFILHDCTILWLFTHL